MISRDLETLVETTNVKGQGKDGKTRVGNRLPKNLEVEEKRTGKDNRTRRMPKRRMEFAA
jgi:hypothetical protein